MGELAITDILAVLPHRYPFLLVDRIVEWEANVRIVGLKNVTANEPFFPGHFPGRPIMPGVLILETMAQVGGVLAFKSAPPGGKPVVYLTGVDEAKFRKPVVPGDRLLLHVRKLRKRGNLLKFACEATVDDAKVAEAEIQAMMVDND